TSIDIYKKIKPYRRLLGQESLKQKSIECFLGIHRQDPYSGGQLIEVYEDYLQTHESVLYDMLMLHNAEDLEGMPLILPILNYPDFFEHDFTLISQQILKQTDLFGETYPILSLVCESDYRIPVAICKANEVVTCRAENNGLNLRIVLYEGELKYFYPNYKDYYYLPYEDTAIHKSVGEYVDREARIKATAKTCYIKKQGCFLPQYQILWEPALQIAYKDKVTYTEYRESLFQNPSDFSSYLHQLLSSLI
ncbi:MAG: ribonuclease H-like domain-containing protein, partial [Hungatella sp.]